MKLLNKAIFICIYKTDERQSINIEQDKAISLEEIMRKICYLVIGMFVLLLLVSSASASYENLTPSFGKTYDGVFTMPTTKPSFGASYDAIFTMPTVKPLGFKTYDAAFKIP